MLDGPLFLEPTHAAGPRANTRATDVSTIGISVIKCESRMGETPCRGFTDSCFANTPHGAKPCQAHAALAKLRSTKGRMPPCL